MAFSAAAELNLSSHPADSSTNPSARRHHFAAPHGSKGRHPSWPRGCSAPLEPQGFGGAETCQIGPNVEDLEGEKPMENGGNFWISWEKPI